MGIGRFNQEIDKSKITPELIKKYGKPILTKEELETALNVETLLIFEILKTNV